MTESAFSEVDLAAKLLTQQISACHDAAMAVFKFAENAADADKQMSAMITATRMMHATATAASALKRLKSDGTRHTVAVERDERDIPHRFSKTNNHSAADA
jgi:hypothetical protein